MEKRLSSKALRQRSRVLYLYETTERKLLASEGMDPPQNPKSPPAKV
jgi:hypothetical protein